MDTKLLNRVRALTERGERIPVKDGEALFGVTNLIELAKLVRLPRERRFGKRAFYKAIHTMRYNGEQPAEYIANAHATMPGEVAELAIHCTWRNGDTLDTWLERFTEFGKSGGGVTAYCSAGFIAAAAVEATGASEGVIEQIRERVPLFITGDEAEVFDSAYRNEYSPAVVSSERWLAVHQTAHKLGLKTGAAMTYTTESRTAEYAAHLEALRRLQDETGGFIQFTPMAMHNADPGARYLTIPSAVHTAQATAVSRLLLDNIPHIVAAPGLVTAEVAYAALNYGADTIDASISPGDVHTRYNAPNAGHIHALQVLDSSTPDAEEGSDIQEVQQRLTECRWTPVAVDTAYGELEMTAA